MSHKEIDGFCTDCGSWTRLHKGRCGCGSGRVACPPHGYAVFSNREIEVAPSVIDKARQFAEAFLANYPNHEDGDGNEAPELQMARDLLSAIATGPAPLSDKGSEAIRARVPEEVAVVLDDVDANAVDPAEVVCPLGTVSASSNEQRAMDCTDDALQARASHWLVHYRGGLPIRYFDDEAKARAFLGWEIRDDREVMMTPLFIHAFMRLTEEQIEAASAAVGRLLSVEGETGGSRDLAIAALKAAQETVS